MNVHLSVIANYCLIGCERSSRREVAYAGTKLLYQPVPQPIVYIVPVTDILGRIALVPYGEHGTIIPYGWRALARHYPRGE